MITKEFIAHRVNTIAELKETPENMGVEIDLRAYEKRIILHHEPFENGEDFETFIKHYRHGTLILNVKCERIEWKILEIIRKYKVEKYFFLDSSFPMINLMTLKGERNIAIRFSEYEGLDTILALKGKIEWVWVDCFSKLPLNPGNYKTLKEAGYKLCLVSPELVSRKDDITSYRNYLLEQEITVDAICTKQNCVSIWK